MLIKFYHRFFEVDNRISDKVITVRISFFLMLIGIAVCLAAALHQEMERKQVISL
jgi:hypothetical protein